MYFEDSLKIVLFLKYVEKKSDIKHVGNNRLQFKRTKCAAHLKLKLKCSSALRGIILLHKLTNNANEYLVKQNIQKQSKQMC